LGEEGREFYQFSGFLAMLSPIQLREAAASDLMRKNDAVAAPA
jgi:hypothetical protein